MSYTALYRKFRPDEFEDVKGQDAIVRTLKNQINADRIGHAYLFCGTRGTGKTTVAKIFAKAVNCEHPVDGSPCGECAMCKSIAAGTSMNVIEIDAASNNGVDNIREIREEVTYRPTEGKYKVYIIDEVHMLSIGAFNALLKTLEEPPEYITIILIGSNENSFLSTIKSRCTILRFKDIKQEEIEKYLEENGIYFKDKRILKACSGSIGKALKVKDKQDEYENIHEFIENIGQKDIIEIFQKAEFIYNSKDEIKDILQYINILLLELAKENYKYAECVEIVEDTKKRLQSNANYDMTIDNMLMKMKEKIR